MKQIDYYYVTNLFILSDSNLHLNMLLIFDLKIFLETDNFDSDGSLFHKRAPVYKNDVRPEVETCGMANDKVLFLVI